MSMNMNIDVHLNMERGMYERLVDRAQEMGVPLSAVVRDAVAEYFEHLPVPPDRTLAASIPDDPIWELPNLSEGERHNTFPFLKPLMEGDIPIDAFHQGDMIVVGDPEQCFNKMKHYADLGVDELICYVQFGFHTGESTLKTIELLGKEVIPELEKYTPLDVGANIAQFID